MLTTPAWMFEKKGMPMKKAKFRCNNAIVLSIDLG